MRTVRLHKVDADDDLLEVLSDKVIARGLLIKSSGYPEFSIGDGVSTLYSRAFYEGTQPSSGNEE